MVDISPFIYFDKPFVIRGEENLTFSAAVTLTLFDFVAPDVYSIFIEHVKFGFSGGEMLYRLEGANSQSPMFDLMVNDMSVLSPMAQVLTAGQHIGNTPHYDNPNHVIVARPNSRIQGLVRGANTLGDQYIQGYMQIAGHLGIADIKDANYFGNKILKTVMCEGGSKCIR